MKGLRIFLKTILILCILSITTIVESQIIILKEQLNSNILGNAPRTNIQLISERPEDFQGTISGFKIKGLFHGNPGAIQAFFAAFDCPSDTGTIGGGQILGNNAIGGSLTQVQEYIVMFDSPVQTIAGKCHGIILNGIGSTNFRVSGSDFDSYLFGKNYVCDSNNCQGFIEANKFSTLEPIDIFFQVFGPIPPEINVNLSWTKNNDPDFESYRIYRDSNSNIDLNDTLVTIIKDANKNTFLDKDLVNNKTYFYKIFIFDHAGLSNTSNEVNTK